MVPLGDTTQVRVGARSDPVRLWTRCRAPLRVAAGTISFEYSGWWRSFGQAALDRSHRLPRPSSPGSANSRAFACHLRALSIRDPEQPPLIVKITNHPAHDSPTPSSPSPTTSETKTEAGKRTLPVPEFLQSYLRDSIKGKKPTDLLFGRHWRDWPREWVQRICKVAKVPQVTAHGMRGLHGTLRSREGRRLTSWPKLSVTSRRPPRSPASQKKPNNIVELNGIEPSAS